MKKLFSYSFVNTAIHARFILFVNRQPCSFYLAKICLSAWYDDRTSGPLST